MITISESPNNIVGDKKTRFATVRYEDDVVEGFEYSSGNNEHFLSIEELKEYDKHAEL